MRRVFAALVALALPLTACQRVTRAPSSQVSPCFRVLPQAATAVGKQGRLVSVHRIRGRPAARTSERVAATTEPPVVRDICIITYHGTFDHSRIEHLIDPGTDGTYAVVIVGLRRGVVRGVLLLSHLPDVDVNGGRRGPGLLVPTTTLG